jgi:hypothetical protein
MNISYKVDQGIQHIWHGHPAFAPIPVDDDELIQDTNQQQTDNGMLSDNTNLDQVSEFWASVVDDLRAKGELNDYDDGADEAYLEDPAYK